MKPSIYTDPPPPHRTRLVVPASALVAIEAGVDGAFVALAQAAVLLAPAEGGQGVVTALTVLYEHLSRIHETVRIIVEENHGS